MASIRTLPPARLTGVLLLMTASLAHGQGPSLTLDTAGHVLCHNAGNGWASVSVSGGTPPYTIEWQSTPVQTGPVASGLPAGPVVVVATDGNGATDTLSVVIEQPAAPLVVNITGQGDALCYADSTGWATVEASGGQGPYTYSWSTSPPATGDSVGALPPGYYQVLATDQFGCQAAVYMLIQQPIDPISLLFENYAQPTCAGANDGWITVQASGASGTFTYAWNTAPPQTGDSIHGLGPGSYTVTVTDPFGCDTQKDFMLSLGGPTDSLTSTVTVSDVQGHAVACAGDQTGWIDLQVAGGTAPYIFSWTGPGLATSTEDPIGLAAGTYQFGVIDANGCLDTGSVMLTEPPPLLPTIEPLLQPNGANITCPGGADGGINATATGGVAPLQFAWAGPQGFSSAQDTLHALQAGLYTLSVTDANGCTASVSVTLAEAPALSFNAQVGQVTCNGLADGSIIISMPPSTTLTDATWSGPDGFNATGLNLDLLAAGSYTLVATDQHGCVQDTTVEVPSPQPLVSALSTPLTSTGFNVSCAGAADGSIDLAPAGGSAPYAFSWTGPNGAMPGSEDQSGVEAGTYIVVVSDSNQCTLTDSITLTGPAPLAITTNSSLFPGGTALPCADSDNGWAAVAATGGNGGTTFDWTGPNGFSSSSDSLQGLGIGVYAVLATDAIGCAAATTVTIDAPNALVATVSSLLFPGGTPLSCAGATDGVLNASISGGTGGYAFTWNGPGGVQAAGPSLTGAGPGTWCVLVTDTNGCTGGACMDLIDPAPLQATLQTTAAPCGTAVGTIDLAVSGGSGALSFLWSSGAVTEDLGGLTPGTYSVSIADANGCSFSTGAIISGGPALDGSLVTGPILCHGANDGTIDVTLMDGEAPFSFQWSNGASSASLAGLQAGTYTVLVTDANGCTWSGTADVGEPPSLMAEALVQTYANGHNVSAPGAQNGSVGITVTGGAPPYAFNWAHGASGATLGSMGAGTYVVTIEDANGCAIDLTVTLTGPEDIAMPTGFSPNGDGANDTYVVLGLDAYPSNRFTVFNRWGNLVYEHLNYRNGWAGENTEGQALPNGTYFVMLDLNEGGRILQNYVDLRR